MTRRCNLLSKSSLCEDDVWLEPFACVVRKGDCSKEIHFLWCCFVFLVSNCNNNAGRGGGGIQTLLDMLKLFYS